MTRHLALVLFASALGLPAQAPQLTYQDLLQRVTQREWLFMPPPAGERGVQFSSYDRSSDKGPSDAKAWFGNGDCSQYLRVEERGGKKEFVMVDTDGPGCITRLWSANPKGKLFFDVDGQRVWEVDFAALTKGKLPGLGEPWCGEHARGCNCYLPIPFGKHLVVSASEDGFYYQVNIVHFEPGTTVPSFSAAMLQEQAVAITAAGTKVMPSATMLREASSENGARRVQVPSGSLVRELMLAVAPPAEARDIAAWRQGLGDVLRATLLVVRCGDEETVRVPVSDFFNGGADWRPHHGAMLGIDARTGYCRLPMPMPAGGTVELVADDATAAAARLSLTVLHGPFRFAAAPLLFRASYHQVKNDPTRPFHDHLVLDARGQGRFCGTSLLVKNPTKGWWGEGDEKFYVDGESFPSTFGTGTEDYFGYAWCCNEVFSAAFHAQPQCDGPGNYGFSAVNRVHVFDSVPFQQSFRFDLEVWHWVDCKVDYATVAYWYGAAGASSGLPAVPAAAERTLDRLPPYAPMKVKGAIEGESLAVKSCSGGRHEVQELGDELFSDGKQRWWMDGQVGDELTLVLPVPKAGRYRIKAQFCTAADYGIVQVHLAGQKLGAPIDLFHKGIKASGAKELGILELPAGDVALVLEVTGRNPEAVDRRMVGLDYLLLEPAQ